MTLRLIRRPVAMALAVALTAAVSLAGCKKDAPAPVATTPAPAATPDASPWPSTAPAPAATAIDVRAITLGRSAGADRRVAQPMTTFAPTDPIVVAVDTDGAANNVQLAAKLVYQDGQTAGEQSQGLNTTGAESTAITFTNANPWPAGSYTAEVWVDGVKADSATFTVR